MPFHALNINKTPFKSHLSCQFTQIKNGILKSRFNANSSKFYSIPASFKALHLAPVVGTNTKAESNTA